MDDLGVAMCLPTDSGKRLPSIPSNQTDPEVRHISHSVGLAGPFPGRNPNHSPATSVDVKSGWACTSASPY
jgi:hypothetical protein